MYQNVTTVKFFATFSKKSIFENMLFHLNKNYEKTREVK